LGRRSSIREEERYCVVGTAYQKKKKKVIVEKLDVAGMRKKNDGRPSVDPHEKIESAEMSRAESGVEVTKDRRNAG